MRGDPVTVTDGTASGWRARWVRRENERRRTAYETAVQAWRRRDGELRQFCARAEEPAERADTPAGLPVPLEPGELVALVQPAAELVEVTARHTTGLPAPELTVVPVDDPAGSPRLPKGVAVADAGMAVVTDQRLILIGRRGTWEWSYPQLAGVAHDPHESFTLLHPHGRGRIRGVRVPASAASAFRLRLTVAYADAIGERNALLDGLDAAVAAHWHRQPAVPSPATQDEAPATARLARPALVAAVAVLVALAAVVGVVRWSVPEGRPVVGMEVDDGTGADPTGPGAPSPSTDLGAPVSSTAPTISPGATGTPVPGSPDPGSTAAAPTAGPAGPAGPSPGEGAPPSRPPQPPSTGSPQPTASTVSPSPTPDERCGAPENPWGYNYCGGSRIYPADIADKDVCGYFDCVDNPLSGEGYMLLCEDDLVSMTGGQPRPCADHGGPAHRVYAPA